MSWSATLFDLLQLCKPYTRSDYSQAEERDMSDILPPAHPPLSSRGRSSSSPNARPAGCSSIQTIPSSDLDSGRALLKLLAARIAFSPLLQRFYGDCRVPQRVTSAGKQGVDFPQFFRICRAMFEIYKPLLVSYAKLYTVRYICSTELSRLCQIRILSPCWNDMDESMKAEVEKLSSASQT